MFSICRQLDTSAKECVHRVAAMVQARGALLGAVLAVLMASSAADMYPDDHWSYSTKLTTSNYQVGYPRRPSPPIGVTLSNTARLRSFHPNETARVSSSSISARRSRVIASIRRDPSVSEHIKSEVDAGRTLFVRWIASEG